MSGRDLRHAGQGAGLRHLRGLVAILTVCISFLSVDGEASYAGAHPVGTCVRIMVDDVVSDALEAEAGGAVRPADEFEPAVDDDVLVGLGDAAAADQDGRVGRPPLVQWDDDAHSRPPIQPIRKASARRIIAVWLMPFLRSPGWPASR